MRRSSATHEQNSVTVDDKGVVVITLSGPQTRETVKALGERVLAETTKRRAQGKKVLYLTDISNLKMSEVSSGARQEGRNIMSMVPEKGAVYGKSVWMSFIMYMVQMTGMGKTMRFFTSKRRAIKWLEMVEPMRKAYRPSSIALITGMAIMIIGLLALIGWQTDNAYLMRWIPSLRPMNPMAAVGLLSVGLGFVLYWFGRLRALRWAGAFDIVLGIAALLPLGVDALLYGSRVAAAGPHVQLADSAAICFIATGIIALVVGRTARWVRPVETVLTLLIGAIALLNIFGQMYGYDWMYGVSDDFVMSYNLAGAFLIATVGSVLLLAYKGMGVNVLTRVTRIGWLIVVALLFIQAATYGAWLQAKGRNEASASASFMTDVKDIETVLKNRFDAYTNALYGFQGLYLSSNGVNQGEFTTYYNNTNIAKKYPGLRSVAYVSKVGTKDLDSFVRQQRQDTSLNPEGNTLPSLKRDMSASTHYIVTYVASSSALTGTDLSYSPERVAAFQKAEATHQPVASGSIEFVASGSIPKQSGFFITIPVANENDPNRTVGFVNAAFAYDTFFKDTFDQSILQKALNIRMIDTYDGRTVYALNNVKGQKTKFTHDVSLTVADRTWRLLIGAPATFGNAQNSLPSAILVSGQVFSVLLIIIFWIQARGRHQALELVDSVTKDLQHERNRAVANDQKSTAILASIGDGVFAIDTKERIVVFNEAAQEISGVTEKEALGQPYGTILRFEDQKSGRVNDVFIKKALRGHVATMPSNTLLSRKDGKHVPVADSAAPIRDASGKIIGAIIVFRDVSKEQELDRAKSEFVSLASHQLRTPLSAINWYGEMLLNGDAGKLTKDQHDYIREIFEGSQRMVELVNSLLNVSRIEIGKLVTQPEPTNVPQLVEALEKELAVSIKEKALVYKARIDTIPDVVADPKQLRMVVQNLMSNAVKYTPEKGEVTVTLRMAKAAEVHDARLKPEGKYWYFAVKDNGYGIPKDQQAKIFGKMFRADNVRKLDVEGTGLGLYIVKEMVEKMGGRVWFDSMESVGTTFHVVVPVQSDRDKQKKEGERS